MITTEISPWQRFQQTIQLSPWEDQEYLNHFWRILVADASKVLRCCPEGWGRAVPWQPYRNSGRMGRTRISKIHFAPALRTLGTAYYLSQPKGFPYLHQLICSGSSRGKGSRPHLPRGLSWHVLSLPQVARKPKQLRWPSQPQSWRTVRMEGREYAWGTTGWQVFVLSIFELFPQHLLWLLCCFWP